MPARRAIVSTLIFAVVAGAVSFAIAGRKRPVAPKLAAAKARKANPMSDRVEKTEAEWKKVLTPEQFYVARQKGTERAFTGAFHASKEDGVYKCVCCGQPLFDSKTKYDSGSGWPSYWAPTNEDNVTLHEDNSWVMSRTEVMCSRCDAHLGHVFDDGPAPTGLRYCINSASLKFDAREKIETAAPKSGGEKP